MSRGSHATAIRLSAEVYSILGAWGVHRYASTAWLLLENALELQKADDLFAKIRLYFHRRWHNPVEFTGE